jgi:formylglycine-generating enzyme required for sulfatase activity
MPAVVPSDRAEALGRPPHGALLKMRSAARETSMRTDSRWQIAALVAAISSVVFDAKAQAQCVGDIVPDGRVDGIDLGVLLGYWGPRTSATFSMASDLNHDGFIDGSDLGTLLGNWGPCVVPPFNVPAWATLVSGPPDPAIVTDPMAREAIAATGWAWHVRDTATQIEMLLVPQGTFQMGCIMGSNQYGCYGWEQPVHTVTLTQPFYLGRYEVTQAQWQARMGLNPSSFQSASAEVPASAVPNRPVEQVSWNTIQGFCSATGMRLPTEAEWEYACRAGTQTPFYNGSMDDNTVGNLAWYSPNSGGLTRPVGGKAPNAFGFHDMLGNVWEWVNDWFGTYTGSPQVNPTGPSFGQSPVIRGGSYMHGSDAARSSARSTFYDANGAYHHLGFRVARNP